MEKECSTYGGEGKRIQGCSGDVRREETHLKDLGKLYSKTIILNGSKEVGYDVNWNR
jgi:hypothetical protein